jgi:hypothetical protein
MITIQLHEEQISRIEACLIAYKNYAYEKEPKEKGDYAFYAHKNFVEALADAGFDLIKHRENKKP